MPQQGQPCAATPLEGCMGCQDGAEAIASPCGSDPGPARLGLPKTTARRKAVARKAAAQRRTEPDHLCRDRPDHLSKRPPVVGVPASAERPGRAPIPYPTARPSAGCNEREPVRHARSPRPANLEERHDARSYIEVIAPAPLAVVRWRQANRYLLEAELVRLIVVPKVSGTTRRCSLAMGTLRRRCGGMGRRTGWAIHAASVGGDDRSSS